MFAFRHKETGEFLGFHAEANEESEFCCSISYSLISHKYAINVYANYDLKTMENIVIDSVTKRDIPWYSQDYDTPSVFKEIDMTEYEIVNLLTLKK